MYRHLWEKQPISQTIWWIIFIIVLKYIFVVLLKITDPPTIQTIPDMSIIEGETLSIVCQVTSSSPLPSLYTWTKVEDGTFNQTEQVLTIADIQRGDAGTYRCTVVSNTISTNGSRREGNDTEDVVVDVLCMLTLF